MHLFQARIAELEEELEAEKASRIKVSGRNSTQWDEQPLSDE